MLWTLPLLTLNLAPIDFQTKVMALGPLLDKLSAESGVSLKAAPRIAHEIVFVDVRDVTLEDLKKRLAEAVDGEWSKKSDAEYLERGAAIDREIWKRHVALRRGYLNDELARLRQELEQPFDGKSLAAGLAALRPQQEFSNDRAAATRNARAQEALFAKGPAARFIKRLILACNPDDLAAVGPSSRVIFKPNPTAMQRGFDPKRFQEAVALFTKEQGQWVEAAAAVTFPEDRSGRTVSDPRTQTGFDKPEEVFEALEIRRSEMAALFSVNLIGRHPRFGRQIISQTSLADPARKFLNEAAEGKPAGSDDPEVKLSPESEEFRTMLIANFVTGGVLPKTESMVQLLLNPDKVDPLSFGASEVLASYAKEKKLNVVASVPDSALGLIWFSAQQGPLKLYQSMKTLSQGGPMRLTEQGGWAILAPTDRYEAAFDFTPRDVAATLMKSVAAKGVVDIRDYATYAFKSGRLTRLGVGEIYLGLYDRSTLSTLDRTDWNGLQLYGSFNDTQRKALEEGAKFPMKGLSTAQKAIVERISYASEIRSETQLGDGSASHMGTPIEPTDAFPNGLPVDGNINARVKKVDVIVAYGKGQDGKPRPLRSINAWTLATVEDFKGDEAKMSNYGMSGLVGYAPGAEKMIALRVQLSPTVWKELALTVPDHNPNAKPVAWEQLPAPLAEQIRAAIQQSKNQKANQGTSTIPPR